MSLTLTLLGTGDAAQVPVFGCDCLVCVRARAVVSYQRKPCSAMLTYGDQLILIDSGLTDLAHRFNSGEISQVLQTHYHPDHVQGLLHLRWGMGPSIPVYGPEDPEGFADLYKHPGILSFQPGLKHGDTLTFDGLRITALSLVHSKPTLGYLIQTPSSNVMYCTDTVGLPEATLARLQGLALDCLIIDCSHPPQAITPRNHNDVNSVLALQRQLNCDEVILTHLGHQMDLWLHHNPKKLPSGITIGFDDMKKTFK
ncbi:MAG: phosphonate metabolism protein PhnP [Neisseriaceae bacterium]|nr:phosphonate metabolism protein PhnP [Neisseriaceae bacterium]